MKVKSRIPWPPVQTGQVWRMNDTTCQIGLVGKRLVHYKIFKGKPTRVPATLANKEVLEKHLKAKKAVLVEA